MQDALDDVVRRPEECVIGKLSG
jgi:hypothetical protein